MRGELWDKLSRSPPLREGPRGGAASPPLGFIYAKGGVMPEQYTYQVGKIHFIVTPVYKDKRLGETMEDILLKLMLADLENGDILNTSDSRRYNILGNTDCPTPVEGGHFETVG
jgi:hypothetical protein